MRLNFNWNGLVNLILFLSTTELLGDITNAPCDYFICKVIFIHIIKEMEKEKEIDGE